MSDRTVVSPGSKESRLLVVGELLNCRPFLHPDTSGVTVSQLAARYEAVAAARSALASTIMERARGALDQLPAATLVKCCLVTNPTADLPATICALADLPDHVGPAGVSLACVTRTSRAHASETVTEFRRLMASMPADPARPDGPRPPAAAATAATAGELQVHGTWRGGFHAHGRVAADIADLTLADLRGDFTCVRIDGSGTLRSVAASPALADLRYAAQSWTQWFAGLGRHAAVRASSASVVMSISDDAVLLVPRNAERLLRRDLRADFERSFPQSGLRWASTELTESSTPFSVARSYSAKLCGQRLARA